MLQQEFRPLLVSNKSSRHETIENYKLHLIFYQYLYKIYWTWWGSMNVHSFTSIQGEQCDQCHYNIQHYNWNSHGECWGEEGWVIIHFLLRRIMEIFSNSLQSGIFISSVIQAELVNTRIKLGKYEIRSYNKKLILS